MWGMFEKESHALQSKQDPFCCLVFAVLSVRRHRKMYLIRVLGVSSYLSTINKEA